MTQSISPCTHHVRFVPGEAPTYVEEYRPAGSAAATVVLVHGGLVTGACYLVTADGRPGWVHRFLQHGLRVVVVDWPGVGRSGRVPEERCTGELVCNGLGAVLESVGGPVTLLTHSMSGPYGFRLLQTHPHLIEAMVAVAPGPPGNIQPEATVVGGSDEGVEVQGVAQRWFIPHTGGVLPDRHLAIAKMIGDSTRFPRRCVEDYVSTFVPIPATLTAERLNVAGRQLTADLGYDVRGRPVLVVTGSADTDHPEVADRKVVDWLIEQGVDATFRYLDEPEVAGNGHMLMAETNSDAIADEIARWVLERHTG